MTYTQFKKVEGLNRFIGMMFDLNDKHPLVFENKEDKRVPFHSAFCPTFLAITESSSGFESAAIIKPFQWVKPEKPYLRLYEIPLDEENERRLNKKWHKQKRILEMQNNQLVKEALG